MPYISIVIPIYKSECTLERCIDSVLHQTFSDIEIILVDDGSPDNCGKICEKVALMDSRVRVLHKQNNGVSAARNSGIQIATGNFLLFTDSDDYLPLTYCQEIVDAQNKFGKDSFIWSGIRMISENDRITGQSIYYDDAVESVLYRKDIFMLSYKYLLNPPWNKLYNLDLIHKNNIRMNENISIAEDLLFNINYLKTINDQKIVILNHVMYNYVRSGNVSLDFGYIKNYYTINKAVLGEMLSSCKYWGINKEDYKLFYYRYWDYMQASFKNIDHPMSNLSTFQKFYQKSMILKDNKFQKSIRLMKNSMGRKEYYALKSRLYFGVWLIQRMRKKND